MEAVTVKGHRKAPGQTGLELGLKESYKEDLANHFGLKLYADGRTRIPSHLVQNDPQIRKIGAARNQRRHVAPPTDVLH